jgi:2,3-diketo-5-methylthio-1-phosphopentane phosphatase
MSLLRVYAEDDAGRARLESSVGAQIAAELAAIGVVFDRWPVRPALAGADAQQLLDAYEAELEALGHATFDVVSMTPDDPQAAQLREKFLSEHTHAEDEVRFFATGRGLFCLHAAGRVYQLLCEAGDLIRVPAQTRHWFDMGAEPRFAAIRGFDNREGWIPAFTGADIASRFPRLEPFVERERQSSVLIDVEGTVSPTAFVRDVLFPYARRAIPRYVAEHAEADAVRDALEETCREAGLDPKDREGAIAQLLAWSDADAKRAPLKELQGRVWEAGFRDGSLVAPLYPDALERLEYWSGLGIPLHVYSSGSVQAQRLFFGHTTAGDRSGWFGSHFDTRTGPKDDPRSYQAIAKSLGKPESQIFFLSDSPSEIRAARLAGMRVCRVARPEEQAGARAEIDGAHEPCVSTLRDVAI